MGLVRKYKQLPQTLKASIWFVIALLFQKGINVLTTPVFTRLMTHEEYGTFSLFNTWYNIFLVVCTFNLFGGIFNTIVHKNQDRKDEMTSSTMGFELVLTVVVFVGYLVFYLLGGNLQGLDFTLSLLVFAQVLVNIPMSVWMARCKYEYQYRVCAAIIIIQSFLVAAAGILCVIFAEQKVLARVVSNVVILLVVSVVLCVVIAKQSPKLVSLKNWKYLFLLGAPLVIHYLAQDVMAQSDQLILDYYHGTETVAVYSLSHSLSWLFTILTTAINTTFVPWVYRRMDEKNFSGVRKISLLIIFGISFITLLVSLISPEVIRIFGGEGYEEGAKLIPILICNVVVIAGYDLFSNVAFYHSKTLVASIVTLVSAGVNIALNFLFIPKYGMIAACFTTLASYLCMMFLHFIIMKYYMKKFGLTQMYRASLIWAIVIAFILLNLSVLFLLEYVLVRYLILGGLILALTLVLVLTRKKWIPYLKGGNKDATN